MGFFKYRFFPKFIANRKLAHLAFSLFFKVLRIGIYKCLKCEIFFLYTDQ